MLEKFYNENFQKYLNFTSSNNADEENTLMLQTLRYVSKQSEILDVGCGPGYQLKYFQNKHHRAQGFDISYKFVDYCKSQNLNVEKRSFFEFETKNKFDIVWANASLIHCNPYNIRDVMRKYSSLLNQNGIFFCNFILGSSYRYYDERTYLDMNLHTMKNIVLSLKKTQLINVDYTTGLGNESPNTIWINFFLRKN